MRRASNSALEAVQKPTMAPTDLPFHHISGSEEGTREIAASFSHLLEPGDRVLLSGPLGAGKTAFVRGLAAGLGMTDLFEVDSPTYTIVNRYDAGPGIDHLDLYRIHHLSELEEIGFEDMLASSAILVVEWPERLDGYPLEGDAYLVRLEATGEHTREITIRKLRI